MYNIFNKNISARYKLCTDNTATRYLCVYVCFE